MNQNSNHKFSDGERILFKSIADHIQANPNDYKKAGEWLDEYCSKSAYWLRQEDKLGKLKKDHERFPVLTYQEQVDHLENEIKERRTPALIIRFQEARNYLLDNYRDQEFVSKEIAAKVIIITWLLTDPDAEKKKVGITELETWHWEPIDDVSKMTRGYAGFLFSKTEELCKSWLRLLRICFQIKEREANREKWFQSRPIQAALIGAGVLLLVSIVGWFLLYIKSDTNRKFSPEAKTSGDSSPAVITSGPNSPVTVNYDSPESKVSGTSKLLTPSDFRIRLVISAYATAYEYGYTPPEKIQVYGRAGSAFFNATLSLETPPAREYPRGRDPHRWWKYEDEAPLVTELNSKSTLNSLVGETITAHVPIGVFNRKDPNLWQFQLYIYISGREFMEIPNDDGNVEIKLTQDNLGIQN